PNFLKDLPCPSSSSAFYTADTAPASPPASPLRSSVPAPPADTPASYAPSTQSNHTPPDHACAIKNCGSHVQIQSSPASSCRLPQLASPRNRENQFASSESKIPTPLRSRKTGSPLQSHSSGRIQPRPHGSADRRRACWTGYSPRVPG